jgi:hypothetical protein
MTKFIARFAKDESGATAIEYGLIIALIAVVIIAFKAYRRGRGWKQPRPFRWGLRRLRRSRPNLWFTVRDAICWPWFP